MLKRHNFVVSAWGPAKEEGSSYSEGSRAQLGVMITNKDNHLVSFPIKAKVSYNV